MRIAEQVGDSAESLDDIIWSINPANDALENILARMRRLASGLFEARQIQGMIDFPDPEALHVRLDMQRRRDFYLYFKEAINNMVKYAQCTEALISVKVDQAGLHMMIRDNGLGFDPAQAGQGNGLKSMATRALKLKGRHSLHSKPGEGTEINLHINF